MKLFKDTVIYSALPFLQKGAAFFLLPVYTAVLAPSDYGIIGSVSAISALLSMLYPLGFDSALQRSAFSLLDPSISLEKIWGTIVVFVGAVSIGAGVLLCLTYRFSLTWMSGDIPFWPYIFIGVVGASLVPFRRLYSASLQIRQKALSFFWVDFSALVGRTAAILVAVLYFKLGALGVLAAGLAVEVVLSLISFVLFQKHIQLKFDFGILKSLMPYALPVVPHMLAGWATGSLAGLALNSMKGSDEAGLYFMALNFGVITNFMVAGFGQAYLPRLYALLSEEADSVQKEEAISPVVLLAVGGFGMVALGLAAFSPEVLRVMARPSYWPAARFVGILALAGFFQGFYTFYGHLLYYEKKGTRYLPVASGVGGIISTALIFSLIPWIGVWGAPIAVVAGVVARAAIAGVVTNVVFRVYWNQYRTFVLASVTTAGCLLFSLLPYFQSVSVAGCLTKTFILLAVAAIFCITAGSKALDLLPSVLSWRKST